MRRKQAIAVGLLTLVMVAALGTGIASAAPAGSKNAETLAIECGEKTLVVVTNGAGSYTPGHILDGNQMLIPVQFTFTVTDENGEVLIHEVEAKGGQRKGQQDDLFTCTFGETFQDPELGELTFTGEVLVFMTPRNQQ